jgi:hypothetical protein
LGGRPTRRLRIPISGELLPAVLQGTLQNVLVGSPLHNLTHLPPHKFIKQRIPSRFVLLTCCFRSRVAEVPLTLAPFSPHRAFCRHLSEPVVAAIVLGKPGVDRAAAGTNDFWRSALSWHLAEAPRTPRLATLLGSLPGVGQERRMTDKPMQRMTQQGMVPAGMFSRYSRPATLRNDLTTSSARS